MSKIILYVLLVIMVASNVSLLYKLKQRPAADPDINNSNETLLRLSKLYYKRFLINSQLNNNIRISESILLTDLNDHKIELKSLVASGPKLIIRSTEDGCGLCIENELKTIKQYSKKIGIENIIVITTHNNVRKLQVFKATNDLPFKIFLCPDLGIPFEKISENVFIFMLTPKMEVQGFFIPEITQKDISESFYSTISKRFFMPTALKSNVNIADK